RDFVETSNLPVFRNLANCRLGEVIREKICDVRRKPGITAIDFGADRIEIHEPRLEQCPRHCFERFDHTAVQLDLVVQGSEDTGDRPLRTDIREPEAEVELL